MLLLPRSEDVDVGRKQGCTPYIYNREKYLDYVFGAPIV